MQLQRRSFVQICALLVLFLAPMPCILAQTAFTDLAGKTKSLTPLPTDAEVAAEKQRLIEAQKPKPLVKSDIPQRVEQVSPKTFMILPREAPLPTGTLAEGFFMEETGEAPRPVQPQVVEKAESVSAATPVLLPKEGGGYEVVTLKKKRKPAVKKQTSQKVTADFAYELDFRVPTDADALIALKQKLEGKDVRYLSFEVSGKMPPLTEGTVLWRKRVETLRITLGLEELRHFIIWQGSDGPQRVKLIATYNAQTR